MFGLRDGTNAALSAILSPLDHMVGSGAVTSKDAGSAK